MATDLDMGLDGHTPGPWLDWETLEWLHEPKHLLARTEDARLIAAAPELLAALRELLGSCTRMPVGLGDGGTYMVTAPTMDAIKSASAAIGKTRA